jgi:hypothetical protein
MFFTADVESLGVHSIVPLKPDGERIPVTNANTEEFVTLLLRYGLIGQVKSQVSKDSIQLFLRRNWQCLVQVNWIS